MNLPKTSADYLADMVRHAELAVRFVEGHTFDTFQADEKTWFAVVRALLVIGEATKRVPQPIRDRGADVPWRQMAGMRDKLVHDYDQIVLTVVWDTVTQSIPELIPAVTRLRDTLLAEEPPPPAEAP